MARRKRCVLPEGSIEHLAQRSNSIRSRASSSSLPSSPTLQIRFKRIFNGYNSSSNGSPASYIRGAKKQRRRPPPVIVESRDFQPAPVRLVTPTERPNSVNSSTNHYHHHFHHHHYSRSNSDASSASSYSTRPRSRFVAIPPQPTEVALEAAAASAVASHHSQHSRSRSHRSRHSDMAPDPGNGHSASVARSETVLIHPASAPAAAPATLPAHHLQPPSETHVDTTHPVRHQSRKSQAPDAQALSRQPSSLFHQQLSQRRPSTSRMPHTASRMASLESISQLGAPSIRIKRNGSVASIRRSPIRNFFFRLFRRRRRVVTRSHHSFCRTLALKLPGSDGRFRQYKVKSVQLFRTKKPPVRGKISQPLNVTKHTGMDNKGTGEVLSIRSRPSRRAPPHRGSSATRYTGYTDAFNNLEYDYRTEHGPHELQGRLDRLQRELDETRELKRQLSTRSRNSSSLPSRTNSVMSGDSSTMDYPGVRRRMSISSANHQFRPPSQRRIAAMDEEAGTNVEEALVLVEYLRHAIAQRIVLRQKLRSIEHQEQREWQQLHSVEEESITGETETVSSFNTISTSSARVTEYQPATSRKQSLASRKVSSASSYHSASEFVGGTWHGDVFYDTNGESISITPISSRCNSRSGYAGIEPTTHKRTASSVRRALRPERMADKYTALMGPENGKKIPPLPIEEVAELSLPKPSKVSAGTPNRVAVEQRMPNRQSSKSDRSSSSSKPSPRPLPPTPQRRNVSAPLAPSIESRESNKSKTSVRINIPRLLLEQRKMSDTILADMVQEMEELQARSMLLSDIAKSQRNTSGESRSAPDDDSLLIPSSDEDEERIRKYQSASDTSSSDLSLAHGLKKQISTNSDLRRNSAHYVLDSTHGEPAVRAASHSSLSTGAALRLTPPKTRGTATTIPLPTVPRKISTAESIAAAAAVNLSRGKINRRRLRSSADNSLKPSSSDASSEEDVLGEALIAGAGNVGVLGTSWVTTRD